MHILEHFSKQMHRTKLGEKTDTTKVQAGKIEGLDSLRFFAFLSIFFYHAQSKFHYGYLGVDLFFVLSSFLLTYLAFREIESKGAFSKTNFFMRRVLRIFPLYYLILLISFVVVPLIDSSASLPENKTLYWTFLSNYDTQDCLFALKFLWSLGVEEQFYLVFIALSFLLRRRVWWMVGILMLGYFIFMLYARHHGISTYSNTITHFPKFSTGIIGGYLFYRNQIKPSLPIGLLLASALGIFIVREDLFFHIIIAVFFLSLIFIFIQFSKYWSNFSLFQWTEKLGIYTYGLYVYSGFILTIGTKYLPFQNPIVLMALELAILMVVAVASYHLFESRFLKLKKYFRY